MKRTPNTIDAHVGARVRTSRALLGMSLERIACELEVTPWQMQKYEAGINRIGSNKLLQISTALHAPLSFFFAGPLIRDLDGPPKPKSGFEISDDLDQFSLSKEAMRLACAFNRIRHPALRKKIIAFIQSVADLGGDDGGAGTPGENVEIGATTTGRLNQKKQRKFNNKLRTSWRS